MSKKPVKVLGIAAVAALSLAVMAGCTPKDADPAESSEPAASQSIETQNPDESVVETPDESVVEDPDKSVNEETPAVDEEAPTENTHVEGEGETPDADTSADTSAETEVPTESEESVEASTSANG